MTKNTIPKDDCFDATFDLLLEGYFFIKNRIDKYHTDIFETRLFGKKAICITGKEAAEIFYDKEKFIRHGASPKRIQKTLTGEKTIQGMDGKAHLDRKTLFLSLVSKPEELVKLIYNELNMSISKWEKMEKIILFNEIKLILCKTTCEWVGIPLSKTQLKKRANDFTRMIDGFGGVGARYRRGKKARKDTEKWVTDIIRKVRDNKLNIPNNSILYIIANYKDLNGKYLDDIMAAKELINIIRPIVAISTYITFMALALYYYKSKLNSKELEMFVQEVRRYYPFTPFVGAKVKKKFIWKGYKFKKGIRVILDVYGINHDARIWDKPYEFKPERFKKWEFNPYEFIPQGGGDPATGHRCPGEKITIEVMKVTLDFLINNISFNVPKQDLNYSMARIPTLPKSGFIMSNIKHKNV